MLNFSISGGSNSVPNLVVPTLSEARIPYILTFFKTQYLTRSTCYFIYYRGVTTKGDLRRRNTVTFPIIKFGARFLAQIVENRETHLSRPFLGLGDNVVHCLFFNLSFHGRPLCDRRHALRFVSIVGLRGVVGGAPRTS